MAPPNEKLRFVTAPTAAAESRTRSLLTLATSLVLLALGLDLELELEFEIEFVIALVVEVGVVRGRTLRDFFCFRRSSERNLQTAEKQFD